MHKNECKQEKILHSLSHNTVTCIVLLLLSLRLHVYADMCLDVCLCGRAIIVLTSSLLKVVLEIPLELFAVHSSPAATCCYN